MKRIRVVIADDDADMRLLTGALLRSDPRLSVVGQACDGVEAVASCRDLRPDVCVLDHRMPGLTGLEAARRILAESPSTRIVLFSSFLAPVDLVDAADHPEICCLLKDAFSDLIATVVTWAAGDTPP